MTLQYETIRDRNFQCLGYRRHSQAHRTNGPATIWESNHRYWDQFGQHHRIGGPAVMYYNGEVHYYVRGKSKTPQEYEY